MTIKTVLSTLAIALFSTACSLQGGDGKADKDPVCVDCDEDAAVPTDDAGSDNDAGTEDDAGSDASVVPVETCKPAVFKSCGAFCVAAHKAYISDSPTATFRFFDGSNATCASIDVADADGYIKCHLAPNATVGQLRFTFLDTKVNPAWAQYGGLDSDLPEMCDASSIYCNWYDATTGTTRATGDDKCDGYAMLGSDGSLTFNGNAGALDADPSTK